MPAEQPSESAEPAEPAGTPAASRPRRLLGIVTLAWLLSLGVDLLLHAGLLARLYTEPSPFLLDAGSAFRRIPAGYLAFFLVTFGLAWVMARLDLRDAGSGLRFGVAAGGVIWGALALGLYSISTAPVALLLGWWLGQSVELGLAGAVIGARFGGVPMRRLWPRVLIVVLVLFSVTVALQSLGLAPAMRLERSGER